MALDSERTAAINGLRQYRQQLQSQVAQLQGDLAAVDRSLQLLISEASTPEPAQQPTGGGYAGLTLQRAVEKWLSDHPDKGFRPSRLANEIQRNGFTPTSKSWRIQTGSAIRRLVEKGVAVVSEVNGKRFYRFHPKSDPPKGGDEQ